MDILVIEDDQATSAYLEKELSAAGHRVTAAADGLAGLTLAKRGQAQLLIVDRMLPKLDGLSLIQQARAAGIRTPALILSALGEVNERVEGLRAGGDDYLVKPFSMVELLARIEALDRRRNEPARPTVLEVGELRMDLLGRTVSRAGVDLDLQPREFRMLEYLMRHSNQVVTRAMLLENVWDYHFDPQANVIDVHISRLRAKLDRKFDKPMLSTVRGQGYILQAS